jgi:hypothetical protein
MKKNKILPKLTMICCVCNKEETYTRTPNLKHCELIYPKKWRAIPIENRFAWNDNGDFDLFEYEWLCSLECMDAWVYQEPTKRILLGLIEVDNYIPMLVVSRTKDTIKLCFQNLRFRLSSNTCIAGGFNHSGDELKIREKDRTRLLNERKG